MPGQSAPGAPVRTTIQLHNARAGHMLPSGDPERYLEVVARATDAGGGVLAEQRWRIGQEWVWWPRAEKKSDNRLAPGEIRSLAADFTMPEGSATVSVRIDHVRISPENHAHHDLGDYPARRTLLVEERVVRPGP